MRPSVGAFTMPNGLVDKKLAPMWKDIERVVEYLPQISHVSYYLESLFNLDRNLTHLYDQNVDHDILKDIQIFQGASAYELAMVDGYSGTLTEWLATLVGPPGNDGVIDEPTLTAIQTGISDNATAITALQSFQASVPGTYVTQSAYDTRVSTVDGLLDGLQTAVDTIPSNQDITDIVNPIVTGSIDPITSALDLLDGRVDQHDVDLSDLDSGLDSANTAFAQFLLDNAGTLTRVTTLESTAATQASQIANVQSVSSNNATNITILTSTTSTHSSDITAVQQTSSQNATNITTLITASNANASIITTLQETTETTATDLTALTTRVGDAESNIITLNATTAGHATTLTSLSASVSTNTAAISAETTTRASETAALSSDVTTLTATAASHSISISTNATAIADVNGNLAARYAITTGGTFISLEDGTTTPGTITLSATQVRLDAEDIILAGTIKEANIGDLEVDTIKIAGGAVSDSAFATATGGTASISHGARQGSVLLIGIFYPTDTTSRTVALKRDSTTLRSFTISSAVPIVIMYVDNPPATTTYSYQATATSGAMNATELLLLEVVK